MIGDLHIYVYSIIVASEGIWQSQKIVFHFIHSFIMSTLSIVCATKEQQVKLFCVNTIIASIQVNSVGVIE
jgi:hypothetical protein